MSFWTRRKARAICRDLNTDGELCAGRWAGCPHHQGPWNLGTFVAHACLQIQGQFHATKKSSIHPRTTAYLSVASDAARKFSLPSPLIANALASSFGGVMPTCSLLFWDPGRATLSLSRPAFTCLYLLRHKL